MFSDQREEEWSGGDGDAGGGSGDRDVLNDDVRASELEAKLREGRSEVVDEDRLRREKGDSSFRSASGVGGRFSEIDDDAGNSARDLLVSLSSSR